MSRPSNKRIPLSGPQTGLLNPFAALDLDAAQLPPGPELLQTPSSQRVTPPGKILIRRATAHRGGKVVHVLHGFEPHHTEPQLADLASNLKRKLGCGGTLSDREIEVQLDDPTRLKALLKELGFKL